MDVSMRGERCF